MAFGMKAVAGAFRPVIHEAGGRVQAIQRPLGLDLKMRHDKDSGGRHGAGARRTVGRAGVVSVDNSRIGTGDSGHRPADGVRCRQSRQVILSKKDHEARAHRGALAFDDAAQATHFKSPRPDDSARRRRTS
jgi:hypothetical protein